MWLDKMNIIEKIDKFIKKKKNKIWMRTSLPDLQKWVCTHGHEKWIEVGHDFDICNICGTRKAKKVGSPVPFTERNK